MRFAEFTVDAASGELRRNGERVRIQDLPFRVLVALLSRQGELVTRDELRAALWGAETFVDAEAGLNTAVAKLRESLGDSAESPRFIETLPKRGYRFKSVEGAPAPPAAPAAPEPAEAPAPAGPQPARTRRPSTRWVLATAAIALVAYGAWRAWREAQPITIAVVLFHNETGDESLDALAQRLTDGTVVALTTNRRYAVIGNAAILRTPRIFADIKQIGSALDAEYVVLGQLQENAHGPIVRAHFVRVNDQKHLWAKGIQATVTELDALVPQTVADAVDEAIGTPAAQPAEARHLRLQ